MRLAFRRPHHTLPILGPVNTGPYPEVRRRIGRARHAGIAGLLDRAGGARYLYDKPGGAVFDTMDDASALVKQWAREQRERLLATTKALGVALRAPPASTAR